MTTTRTVLAVALIYNRFVHQLDVHNAFFFMATLTKIPIWSFLKAWNVLLVNKLTVYLWVGATTQKMHTLKFFIGIEDNTI
jgi:hypothetical protein